MKAVKVQYTVRPEFVDRNKENIRSVMEALRANPIEGLTYAAFTLDDGQTFVHINMCRDAATLDRFTELAEFKEFQAALKESEPLSPPAPENLNLVAAGFEV